MASSGAAAAGVSSSASVVSAPITRKQKAKNAPGNRSDIGWKYGMPLNELGTKIQCKYCPKKVSGGVYRFKHHLAGTKKDVEACPSVPDEVKKEMFENVASLQERFLKKSMIVESDDEEEGQCEKRTKTKEVEVGSTNFFKKRGKGSVQSTINNMFKKNLKLDVDDDVADFFYANAIPFNVIKSDEFRKMCDSIGRYGVGYDPSSYHDIRVKLLNKKYALTKELIEEHKHHWEKVGCSIMTDGWTNQRRRTIINFLVNNTMGTVFIKSIDASHMSKTAENLFQMIDDVIEEVGEDNVVQIVTDNAANYKRAGELLMQKRKRLFWTPCAAHTIELMLEDFEKHIAVHRETIPKGKKITTYIYGRTFLISLLKKATKGKVLIRPGATRFATSYLTLGCLYENSSAVKRVFLSDEWKASKYSKSNEGKLIASLVDDSLFWKNVLFCIKGAYLLFKVLRLVDSEEPAIGFLYGEIGKAKEEIKNVFKGVENSYMPLWNIIDARWDKHLSGPLHCARYYLNPQIHYGPNFKSTLQLKRGLYDALDKVLGIENGLILMDSQLEDFKCRKNFMGCKAAKISVYNKSPTQWWDSYGDENPELQRAAIRILGLTCSSSACEGNWSAFERVHTKRRNRLTTKKLNDVIFVMVNRKLAKKKNNRKPLIHDLEDLPSDEDWVVEDENETNMEGDLGLDEEQEENLDLETQIEENMVGIQSGENMVVNLEVEEMVEEQVQVAVGDDDDDANFENLMNFVL
ncbi:uncharacterized protein LOC133316764 [Gastrolobium bilobum]|uniref:uncharacterized protein LOC133316764 n=1 Tax=Gastrolobium bilobum TaxID=150636 RepID=UPI002AB2A177|nr:uncharacterized protein LOC133316764 [Gastrolobium bilobum]